MSAVSYSLPLAMSIKKFYCAQCGAKLEKEQTHRFVTKDDIDYYRYQDYNTFPRRDYDVYDYRFMCPGCGKRITFDEQRIVRRIQKKQGRIILSSDEIASHYAQGKKAIQKEVLLKSMLLPFLFALISCVFFCIHQTGKSKEDFMYAALFSLVTAGVLMVFAIRRYKGSGRMRAEKSYPYEKEAQLKKLHTYSVHNKDRIAVADKCYCFFCKTVMDHREIMDFGEDGQTAKCPQCGLSSILPDSIEEPLDEKVIAEMHKYWF